MRWCFLVISSMLTIINGRRFGRVQFEPNWFAEGGMRYAYKGVVVRDPNNGTKVVVKKWKNKHIYEYNFWDEEIEAHEIAKHLVNEWNKLGKTNKKYYVNVPEKNVCIQSEHDEPVWYEFWKSAPTEHVTLNEYVLVEEYLEGEYVKWNGNEGYILDPERSIQAFSHWTYHHSNGQYIMVDAQGVRTKDKYYISDPCIVSNSSIGSKYGGCDVSDAGIKSFFETHKCNQYCEDHWLKPSQETLDNIQYPSDWQVGRKGTRYREEIEKFRIKERIREESNNPYETRHQEL